MLSAYIYKYIQHMYIHICMLKLTSHACENLSSALPTY